VELWELIARERIRDTLARYTWSGDSLRAEELAAAFCEDGELEVRGSEPIRGRAAIATFIAGVGRQPPASAAGTAARRIVRHNVTNIRFIELKPERALVASYFTVLTEVGLDQPQPPGHARARRRRLAHPPPLRLDRLAGRGVDYGAASCDTIPMRSG
jgi:hypothetical protein